jgi:alpha-N-arabinofuranosidase
MNRWQWAVTMIQHTADPAQTMRSTSWHLWELFASAPMAETLPATAHLDPLFYVAGKNAKGTRIWKGAVYNTTNHADVPISLSFEGVGAKSMATLKVLTGLEGPYGFNDPLKGNNVVNSTTYTLEANSDGAFKFVLPELSVALLMTDSKGEKK